MVKRIQFWQFISMKNRTELKAKYKVTPSERVTVANNKIMNDGVTEEDLKHIPIEVLQEVCPIILKDKKGHQNSSEEEEVKEVVEEEKKEEKEHVKKKESIIDKFLN